VVLDVPLLYETGGERLVDAVAVVSARAIVQAQRVLKRPGMSVERLAAVLRRQLPDAVKRRRADFLIRTDLDLRQAKVQIAGIIDDARARPARAWPHRWPLMRDSSSWSR
jgi:dephospho-CoA kinase